MINEELIVVQTVHGLVSRPRTELQPIIEHSRRERNYGGADFSLRVTTILFFNTSFLYLRTEEPLPRSDGSVPEKNDYQVVVGISLRIG
jgi:hypothetical protein